MTDDVAVSARPTEDADHDVVAAIASLADNELRGERGGISLLDHDRPQSDWSDATTMSWVGLVDGIVVGTATAVLDIGPTKRVALVTDLYVHPEGRGVGVGAAMLELVQAWAVEHDATHLESQVLPGMRDSKNFFERLGMVTRAMRVSRPID